LLVLAHSLHNGRDVGRLGGSGGSENSDNGQKLHFRLLLTNTPAAMPGMQILQGSASGGITSAFQIKAKRVGHVWSPVGMWLQSRADIGSDQGCVVKALSRDLGASVNI